MEGKIGKKEDDLAKRFNPFSWMENWLEAYFKEHDVAYSKKQIMDWIYSQPMQEEGGK